MQRLPLETQTLYAELVERLMAFEAGRSFASLAGGFVTKAVAGKTYWYFKTSESATGQTEYFVGPDDAATRRVIDAYGRNRAGIEPEMQGITRLAAMLRSGGVMLTDAPSARVIRGLAAAGLFKLGGVLVGTQAYMVLGNVLGVRWEGNLRTQDIDVAGARHLEIAVPQNGADIPAALAALNMGFLPVPSLNPRKPETSYKVRGQALRVDLLTPASGSRDGAPVIIPRLNAAAQPLEFLDYLLEAPIAVAAVNGGATLVNVPDPARFALHKLALAERRPVSEQAKAAKDLRQAGELLHVLLEDRPGDIEMAIESLRRRSGPWLKRIKRATQKLPEPLSEVARLLA